MAHRILAIDLGAYSVKVAVASAGLRHTTIVDLLERPVPAGDDPLEERAAATLAELLRGRGLDHDVPYAALAGDALSVRLLEFPFHGLKRVDLDKAIGAELEGQLPHELDDLVYTFDVLPRESEEAEARGPAAIAAAGGAPTPPPRRPASSPPVGTRVLAAASTRERVKGFLDLIGRQGFEPRGVVAAPAAYVRIADRLSALGGAEARDDAFMIIDHGHARTNVCVVRRGRLLFARTLSRGGRHVTQGIARAWSLSFEDAERAKHADGFISSTREPAPSAAWGRISEVLKQELVPLVRDLRATLAACRTQAHVTVARAVLCGGGSRLRGLSSYLGEELGLPVGLVTRDDSLHLLGPTLVGRGASADVALVALGVAHEAGTGRPAFDLRQGSLAYRADFSFLRARAGYLAACALLIVAFAALNAYASLYKLRKEAALLEQRLEQETRTVFGQPLGLAEVEERLAPKKEESPLPKVTAFDLLVDISKRLPSRTESKIDVLEIEIEPKRIYVKAIADSSATIDAMEKNLKQIDCFGEIQRGKVDSVPEGKLVNLTIPTKCM